MKRVMIIITASLLGIIGCSKAEEELRPDTIQFSGESFEIKKIEKGAAISTDDTTWVVDSVSLYFQNFNMLVCKAGEYPEGKMIPAGDGLVYLATTGFSLPDGWNALSGNTFNVKNTVSGSIQELNIYFRLAYKNKAVEVPTFEMGTFPVIPIAKTIKIN